MEFIFHKILSIQQLASSINNFTQKDALKRLLLEFKETPVKFPCSTMQLFKSSKKLQECEQNLTSIFETLYEKDQKNQGYNSKPTCHSLQEEQAKQLKIQSFQSDKKLTKILFGQKSYKYKLQLTEDFSKTIYRERNIKLGVRLVSLTGEILKNGKILNNKDNVINLYLSFCDNKGKWVTKNRVGDPMLKGKTSTEMCSGQTEFNKIYPQDISRTFLEGQLNIVVYAKPLAVVYNPELSKSQGKIFINPELIEPLVIENIVIKAKKRSE